MSSCGSPSNHGTGSISAASQQRVRPEILVSPNFALGGDFGVSLAAARATRSRLDPWLASPSFAAFGSMGDQRRGRGAGGGRRRWSLIAVHGKVHVPLLRASRMTWPSQCRSAERRASADRISTVRRGLPLRGNCAECTQTSAGPPSRMDACRRGGVHVLGMPAQAAPDLRLIGACEARSMPSGGRIRRVHWPVPSRLPRE
jgi:hypothetical protein